MSRVTWLGSLALCAALVRCTQAVTAQTSDAGDAATDVASPPTDGGCTTDPLTDPKNCGLCGHDCLGGECRMGVCQPVMLASAEQGPTEIVVDDANVYWIAGYAVRSVSKNGGPVATLNDTAQFGTWEGPPMGVGMPSLAADGSHVYYITFGYQSLAALPRALPEAGAADAALVLSDWNMDSRFTLDGTRLYGVLYDGVTPPSYRSLRWWPTLAADAGVLDPDASTNVLADFTYNTSPLGDEPVWLASDGANLWWTTGNRVFTMPRDGADAGARFVMTEKGVATSIVADGRSVFWLVPATGSVKRLDLPVPDGGTSTVVASSIDTPERVAIDQNQVYFTSSQQDAVFACPRVGCGNFPPHVYASNQAGACGVAVDDRAIYFSTERGGTIMKVAK